MGHEVVYCRLCGVRILESEFGRGGAFRIETTAACGKCREQALASLTPAQKAAIEAEREPPAAPAPPPAKPATVRRVIVRKPGGLQPGAVAGGIAAIGVVGLIVIAVWPSRPGPAGASKPPDPPGVERPRDPQPDLEAEKRRDVERLAAECCAAVDAAVAREDLPAAEAALARFPQGTSMDAARAKVEELRRNLARYEWRTIFDGAGMNGWKRHAAGGAEGNWKIENGVLKGVSSLPGTSTKAMGDEIVFDEVLGDYEVEVTWTAEGEAAGAKTGALGILPRVKFDGERRLTSEGFARAAQGRRLTGIVSSRGSEAVLRIDGAERGRIRLNNLTGQLCIAIAPGGTVRIERIRLRLLR